LTAASWTAAPSTVVVPPVEPTDTLPDPPAPPIVTLPELLPYTPALVRLAGVIVVPSQPATRVTLPGVWIDDGAVIEPFESTVALPPTV
jgi:hypothetical protein